MIDIDEYSNSELEEMGVEFNSCLCLNAYIDHYDFGHAVSVCEECGVATPVYTSTWRYNQC